MAQKKTIVVEICPAASDVFAFKMYHSFASPLGVGRMLISVLFLVVARFSFHRIELLLTVVLFLFGLLNPVVTPMWFYLQSRTAAKSCIPTRYSFLEEKILASDGKKRTEIHWNQLALSVWTKRSLLLYTTPTQAFVLPRRQMGGKDAELLELFKSQADPNRLVIRKHL